MLVERSRGMIVDHPTRMQYSPDDHILNILLKEVPIPLPPGPDGLSCPIGSAMSTSFESGGFRCPEDYSYQESALPSASYTLMHGWPFLPQRQFTPSLARTSLDVLIGCKELTQAGFCTRNWFHSRPLQDDEGLLFFSCYLPIPSYIAG